MINMRCKRTQLGQSVLVALARGDGLLLSLGDSSLGLNGGDPAVTLSSVGGLEGVLVAMVLEVELVGALLGDVANIGLPVNMLLTSFSSRPTKLKMPAGVALSSARLVRNIRPLPVWLAQAATEWETEGFSFWWKTFRFLASTGSSWK